MTTATAPAEHNLGGSATTEHQQNLAPWLQNFADPTAYT